MSDKRKQPDGITLTIDGERLLSQLIFNSDTAPTMDQWLDESSDYWKQQNKQARDDHMCDVIDEWLDNDDDLLESARKVKERKEHSDD